MPTTQKIAPKTQKKSFKSLKNANLSCNMQHPTTFNYAVKIGYLCRRKTGLKMYPSKSTQFKPGQSGNPNGRKKGTKNRATIVKYWLGTQEDSINPITGILEKLTQEDLITLAILKKAKEGCVSSYKALIDNAYFSQNAERNDIIPEISINILNNPEVLQSQENEND